MRALQICGLLAMAALLGQPVCAQPAAQPLPDWVQQKIAAFEANPEQADATEIWRLQYRGQDAFHFISSCCDRYNPLYDSRGKVFCSPNGGITGQGDGQCVGALHTAPERVRIWVAKPPARTGDAPLQWRTFGRLGHGVRTKASFTLPSGWLVGLWA